MIPGVGWACPGWNQSRGHTPQIAANANESVTPNSETTDHVGDHIREAVNLGLGVVEVRRDAQGQSVRPFADDGLDAPLPKLLPEALGVQPRRPPEGGHGSV